MSDFGRDGPHEMPAHFFYRSLHIDYGSAVRANPEKQNCSIWIDSLPKHCLECRRELRELKAARQDYDRWVERALQSDDLELKRRLARQIVGLDPGAV